MRVFVRLKISLIYPIKLLFQKQITRTPYKEYMANQNLNKKTKACFTLSGTFMAASIMLDSKELAVTAIFFMVLALLVSDDDLIHRVNAITDFKSKNRLRM